MAVTLPALWPRVCLLMVTCLVHSFASFCVDFRARFFPAQNTTFSPLIQFIFMVEMMKKTEERLDVKTRNGLTLCACLAACVCVCFVLNLASASNPFFFLIFSWCFALF